VYVVPLVFEKVARPVLVDVADSAVAEVADVALPLNAAVMVPAVKLPLASRCTTKLAVLRLVELIPIV
jgi:hypothetical protein